MELLPFPLVAVLRSPRSQNYAPSASRIHSTRPGRRYFAISPYVTSPSLAKSSSSIPPLEITADDIRRAAFIEVNIGTPYESARIYANVAPIESVPWLVSAFIQGDWGWLSPFFFYCFAVIIKLLNFHFFTVCYKFLSYCQYDNNTFWMNLVQM